MTMMPPRSPVHLGAVASHVHNGNGQRAIPLVLSMSSADFAADFACFLAAGFAALLADFATEFIPSFSPHFFHLFIFTITLAGAHYTSL